MFLFIRVAKLAPKKVTRDLNEAFLVKTCLIKSCSIQSWDAYLFQSFTCLGTQLPQVSFLAVPIFFKGKKLSTLLRLINSAAERKSGQWLENLDLTHLVQGSNVSD